MAFLEERISVDIQHGFSYEDDYNVQITRTAGGSEFRRLIHPIPLRIFTVRFIADRSVIYDTVYNLYHRAFGRFAGFRAKVLDDFSTNANNIGTPTAIDQPTIQLSPTTFQLIKRYGVGGTPLSIGLPVRTLFKPVLGTVKVAVGGIAQLTGWTVNTTTGVITFAIAPVGSVTAGCEFDIPVRFDTAISLRQDNKWRDTSDLKLVELMNP